MDRIGSGRRPASDLSLPATSAGGGGERGLIAIDAQGQVGVARNTRAMPYAFVMGEDEGGMGDGR